MGDGGQRRQRDGTQSIPRRVLLGCLNVLNSCIPPPPAPHPVPAPRLQCKHSLAAALAEALGPSRYRSRPVSDEEMARWLAGV